jgi:hypothetical protein
MTLSSQLIRKYNHICLTKPNVVENFLFANKLREFLTGNKFPYFIYKMSMASP